MTEESLGTKALYSAAALAVSYALKHQKDFEQGLDLILEHWNNFNSSAQEQIRRDLAEVTALGHDFVRKHEDKINRVREKTARS